MSVEKKIPEIRFDGFSGDWKQKTMSEYSSKIGDGLHGTPKYTKNTGIYFINGNNLTDGSICITDETKEVSREDQSKDDISLSSNTILLSINGTIGNLAKYQGQSIMLGKSVAFISLENGDIDYMYTYLKTDRIQKYFLNSLTGSTIKNLGLKAIRESIVLAPEKLNEQSKIGNYFQKLDSLISQHQQKHDKLSHLKKAMLEKMFPKQGEAVPEIRFKGFNGEWEEKELGTDVADIIGGGTPSTSISEFWNGDIDWYSPTEIGDNVYAEGSQKKITALGLKSSSAKILPAGRTVLFTSRAGIGDMAILSRSGATNQGFQSFVVKEGFSPYFIYSIGKQIKEFALKHASGSTFLEISGKKLGRMEILIPCEKEQAAIGNYFQKLDTLINQHQQQITKLTNIKQACLSKMFV
ncbi:type I restriction enzyme, S subunit [Vibrio crassostreae]|uniref:Restriction endonuclease subunit S n=1 Tax=Vibrio pomeroyi TaxID=198832 RepID=A0ABV4MVP5_9VIBR|nr:type I restriction enzyme, S subunit [Vibrio crassostreae]